MPRGQKSKLRARERRRQAREEPEGRVGAQATVPGEGASPSSLSSDLQFAPRSSPATGTPAAAAASGARSKEGASNQVAERPAASQAQSDATNPWFICPLDKRVVMLVHYMLFKYRIKEPISKTDMLKNVIQTYRNHFNEILRRATEHLELIFGLDLKLVDHNRNIYVLINKLEVSCDAKENRGVPKTGVLMTVLGVILIKGNCATEDDIWELLNMMGLYAGKVNLIYGDPKKLITEDFVQQKYLESRQVSSSDPARYEFQWGPRAYAETTKMRVLEFLAKVLDTAPSAFEACYEEALRDEEERAQARAAARARIAATASARARALASSSSHSK